MFAITVHFPLGSFQANSNDDLSSSEWPPHPSRLFSGLVSVAEDASDLAALHWLETLEPPVIVASPVSETRAAVRSNYVVTNAMDRKGRSYMTLPARSGGGQREWLSISPRDPNVSFVWASDEVGHLDTLDALCRRMPYLGRSTSPAVAWIDTTDLVHGVQSDKLWAPDPAGDTVLGVPAPGFLDALELAFQDEQRPWSINRPQRRYRSPGASSVGAELVEDPPFRDREWIIFRVDGRRRVTYPSLLAYTDRFRAAVMAVLGDAAPPVLHGHAPEGQKPPVERVMFLGLPWVGHPNADGRIMGFAVSIPKDHDDRALLYRALVDIEDLAHPRLGRVRLTRRDVDSAWTLNPDRWTRQSSQWVTAYPAVLDRFVRKSDQVAPTIAGMCERIGLPEPTSIDWSPSPLTPGPDRLPARHTRRREGEQLHKFFHVRLVFDRPVGGPIVLGHMRHFGLGLMAPERPELHEELT